MFELLSSVESIYIKVDVFWFVEFNLTSPVPGSAAPVLESNV